MFKCAKGWGQNYTQIKEYWWEQERINIINNGLSKSSSVESKHPVMTLYVKRPLRDLWLYEPVLSAQYLAHLRIFASRSINLGTLHLGWIILLSCPLRTSERDSLLQWHLSFWAPIHVVFYASFDTMGGVAYSYLPLKILSAQQHIFWPKYKLQASLQKLNRWQHITDSIFGEMCLILVAILQE